MKQVLMLAYHYPPIGGAAVMRNARLARLLPEFGYAPTVVTGPGVDADYRWTPRDDTLGAPPSADLTVARLDGPEPSRAGVWRGRSARWLRAVTPWERWWRAGVLERALEAGRDAALIHASVAPYETAATALAVAAALRKPLVLDFEDPWALDEMLVYPSSAHRALERRAMRRTLRGADAVVMNTPEAAARVQATFPELRGRRIASVPNGFDAADFEGPAPVRDDAKLRIVHTGSFHTDMGLAQRRAGRVRRVLGGGVDGVDFLTRSHVFLLRALDELAAERPEVAGRIEVHFAGVLTGEDVEVAERSPFARLHGFLEHDETVRLVRSADLLFLPMHDIAAGGRIGIVPCKTYEYAASGNPILAAVPAGDARDLLGELGTATLCAPADAGAMKAAILEALARRAAGAPPPRPDPAVQARYEFRHLTGRLAALYDELLGERREPGGARALEAVPG